MLSVNSNELYNEETADLVRGVFNYAHIVSGPDIHAKVYHEGALEYKSNWDYEYTTKQHINAHLGGIFGKILDKDGLSTDNLSVEDVRGIADRFWVGGSRYDIRGDMINEDNYKNVISEIALHTSMSFSGHVQGQEVGFLDVNKMPFEFKLDAFSPKEPEEVPVPKKPGIFKRVMNKVFGRFQSDFDTYEKNVKAREAYEAKKEAYDDLCDSFKDRSGKNLDATIKLHAENGREYFEKQKISFNDMIASNEKTTTMVKNEAVKEKVSEL